MIPHIRYAVQIDDGWLGSHRGHDYSRNRPGYNVVQQPGAARLFNRQADATKAAKGYSGTVVPMLVTLFRAPE